MGPQLCSHGQKFVNKHDVSGGVFQWGHNFAVMDSRERQSCSLSSILCFNGATTLQSWTDKNESRDKIFINVSMGPQLCSHGQTTFAFIVINSSFAFQWGHNFAVMDSVDPLLNDGTTVKGFNGATTLQSWTDGLLEMRWRSATWRFNGATTLQSWTGRPFLGLCRYRKKADLRAAPQPPLLFSKVAH